MTTFPLELPEYLAQKLKALPKDKVMEALTDAAANFVEEAEMNDWQENERRETRTAIEEALAEDDAGLSISFEEYFDRERAYFKEKGLDFDIMFAEARPVVEG